MDDDTPGSPVLLDALGNVDTADHRPGRYEDGDLIVYRASEFGSCRKRLIAHGLGITPTAYPHSMLVKFAEGNKFEGEIIAHATNGQGYDGQVHCELILPGGIVVRGHTDAVTDIIIEAKAFAQSTYDEIVRHGLESFPHYAWQVSCYMLGLGLPCRFEVGLKNKAATAIVDYHTINLTEPPFKRLDFIKRAKAIEAAIAAGDLGDCGKEASWPCVFSFLHEDEKNLEDLTADYDVKDFVVRWRMAKEMEKSSKERMDGLKVELRDLMTNRGKEAGVVVLDGKQYTLKHTTGPRAEKFVPAGVNDFWTIVMPRQPRAAKAANTEGTTDE